MESLKAKVAAVLEQEFPPPDRIELIDEDGVIGIVVSERFNGLETIDRLEMIWRVLNKKLTPKQRRDVQMVAVTPLEHIAHSSD